MCCTWQPVLLGLALPGVAPELLYRVRHHKAQHKQEQQHSTAQHSATRHSTAQHGMARRRLTSRWSALYSWSADAHCPAQMCMATRGKISAWPRYLQCLQCKTDEVSRSPTWSEASLRVTATDIQSVTQVTPHCGDTRKLCSLGPSS